MNRLTAYTFGGDVTYTGQHTQLPGLDDASTMRVATRGDVLQRMTAGLPNAIELILPDADSHFRLVPCLCGCSKVTYAKYPLMWRVYCPACGEAVDGEPGQSQHDVQVVWNTKTKEEKTK